MLKKLTNPAVVAGLLGAAASISVALNKPALAMFLNDPATAATATALLTAVISVVAGWMQGPAKD